MYFQLITDNHFYLNQKYQKLGFEETVDTTHFMPVVCQHLDLAVVNALRRIATSEIETLACAPDQIDVKTNTSQYHREVLVDRMGFITIDLQWVENQRIDGKEIKLFISEPDHPDQPFKNLTPSIVSVYVHSHVSAEYRNQPLDITHLCPHNSLLLTLNPGETIHVVMSPTLGLGRQHPRWNSGIVMYKFMTQNDQKLASDVLATEVPIETNQEQLNYLGREHRQPEAIILTFESIGKLDSKMLLQKTIQTLHDRLRNSRGELVIPHSQPKEVIQENDLSTPNFAKFKFIDEDHTLGHVLEIGCRDLLNQLIDQMGKEKEKLLLESLCGYRKPHPLDNYMEVILRVPESLKLTGEYQQYPVPKGLLIKAIDHLVELCDHLLENVDSL
uniref:DNA-directed RNA polymerase RpoA/D/Rpb3-type domain-containing protein n=1 Tax=viral metagenome TaxID=1070528 RepID=A0A6C0BKU8_9ZZZZ